MDDLLSAMVSWLKGSTVSQTVFACVYTHRPAAIKDPLLHAFIVNFLRLCNELHHTILSANTYHEEDFNPSLFGFDFLNGVTNAQALSLLSEAESLLTKQLLKGLAETVFAAISTRLQFIRGLLQAMEVSTKMVVPTPEADACAPNVSCPALLLWSVRLSILVSSGEFMFLFYFLQCSRAV